jgi:hypothetical protein
MNKGLKDTLAELLKVYGGTNYKNYTLEQIKTQVGEALDKTPIKNPAEKAVIIKFKAKLLKMKTAEAIFTEITEKMFSLTASI